jgi:putative copper export protein
VAGLKAPPHIALGILMLPIFEWMQNMPVSAAIQASAWMQAAFNIGHVLSLMVFFGAILIVDLRMLGLGIRDQPIPQVAQDARPWLMGGLIGLLLSGLPQLGALAVRNYYNWFFWFKMSVLLFAIVFTFAVRNRLVLRETVRAHPVVLKTIALLSIALWTTVTVAGRMIGLT